MKSSDSEDFKEIVLLTDWFGSLEQYFQTFAGKWKRMEMVQVGGHIDRGEPRNNFSDMVYQFKPWTFLEIY